MAYLADRAGSVAWTERDQERALAKAQAERLAASPAVQVLIRSEVDRVLREQLDKQLGKRFSGGLAALRAQIDDLHRRAEAIRERDALVVLPPGAARLTRSHLEQAQDRSRRLHQPR